MGYSNFTGGGTGAGGGMPGGAAPAAPSIGGPVDPTELLINYNQKFANSGHILYRDAIVEEILGIMIGKDKPNALLIGPAGTGKTKIVENIAYRIQNNDPLIPAQLYGYTIYELPLSNIVAGSSFVGQVEEKIKAVLDFISDPKEKAILFIDEIHMLVTSSDRTYKTIAQILKPAMARGDIRTIGATTTQEGSRLQDDPAFNRRFSRVIVDELTKTQTVEVLTNALPSYYAHYNNKISLDVSLLPDIVELSETYKTAGSHRPDTSLTLLDRAIGEAVINRKKQEIAVANDPVLSSALKNNPIIPITRKQIRATAIRLATGNNKPENLDIDHLKESLSVIHGQDQILEKLIRKLRENELELYPKVRPMTMLFIGPSGVGKTEVTKIIAKEITGMQPIILNMTEYNSPASLSRIIGAPPGYVGYNSDAELPFDILESNPYQIILLDEFEKCDPAVKTLFMQVFDEGILKDNKGRTIDFSKSIIIATTNAGHTTTKKPLGFSPSENKQTETEINELSAHFDIALLNRFEERITFQEISEDTYRDILIDTYERERTRILSSKPRTQLEPQIPNDRLDKMVKDTYRAEFGARPARQAIHDYIMEQVL